MSNSSLFSRRHLLRSGSGILAASVLSGSLVGQAFAAPKAAKAAKKGKPGAGSRLPIGVQLYSVRDVCSKDFDGALAHIAELGFEGVEFAGYHKYAKDAEGLRKKLDELKLKVAGTHIGAANFAPEKLKETIAFHKTIGCKYLIVPGDNRFTDPEKSKEYAKVMTDAAAALKGEGMACGHHNHTHEFDKPPGSEKTYYELFAERTPQEVFFEQDFGWVYMAGLDPVAHAKKYPGRTKTGHFKAKLRKGTAADKKPFIGEDLIDWKALVTACEEVAGTEWMILEQEDYADGLTPMQSVERSFKGFRKILQEMGKKV